MIRNANIYDKTAREKAHEKSRENESQDCVPTLKKKKKVSTFFSKHLKRLSRQPGSTGSKRLRNIGLTVLTAGTLALMGTGCDVREAPVESTATLSLEVPDTVYSPQTLKVVSKIDGNIPVEEMSVKILVSQLQSSPSPRVFGDTTVSATDSVISFVLDTVESGYLTVDAFLYYDDEEIDYTTKNVVVQKGWAGKTNVGTLGSIDTLSTNELETVVLRILRIGFDSVGIEVSSVADTSVPVFEGSVPVGESVPVYGPDADGDTWYFEPFNVDTSEGSFVVRYNIYSEGM